MEYNELIGLHNPFARNGNFPLDADSVFSSYAEALDYASGGSRDDNYTTAAYLGQIISVVEEDESGNTDVQVYKIVVETPASGETREVWGLELIGKGGGGDGKVKDVQFNGVSFFNEETGIVNFISDDIKVKEDDGKLKLKIVKISNGQDQIG